MSIKFIQDAGRFLGKSNDFIVDRIGDSKIVSQCNPQGIKGDKRNLGIFHAADNELSGEKMLPMIVDSFEEARAIVKGVADAQIPIPNIPSSGVPQPLTTIWTTKAIKQLYKTTTLSQLTEPMQQGAIGVTDIKIPIQWFAGRYQPYNDFSVNGSTSNNYNWIPREVVYLEQSYGWGDLQTAQFSLAKIDYLAGLNESLAITISQAQNDIGFQGYTQIPDGDAPFIYGILNEPNLNPAVSLPNDGVIPGTLTPTTEWMGKDFNQLTRDFRILYSQILQQTEGHVKDGMTKLKLILPPSAMASMGTPNPIGSIPFRKYLEDTYPGIEIINCPNFEASLVINGQQTNQTVVMLMAEHPTEGMPYKDLFVSKYIGHRLVPTSSAYSNKVSYGLAGSFLAYPAFVTFAYGV